MLGVSDTLSVFLSFSFSLFMILSVPLSASIFLNLLLLHIFRDLSPYRPFQELNMKTKCLPMCTEQLSLLQKKQLEITSCLKSSKSGKSWFWKYWLRWVEDGRCTTSYHVTWVQSYILIVFLRCKIGIQYANAKFTGRNLPLKCFLPLPQSVATGGWSMIWGCAANHLGSRVSGGEPCIFTSLPIASTQGQGGKWTRGCCK